MLPCSTNSGKSTDFIDALFMSTTSVCVTGLTTVTVNEHWNFLGKAVITVLMQLGGLGIITFTTIMLMIMGRRITFKERLLIQDAYNLDTFKGLVKLTKKTFKYALSVEFIGMILYCFSFVPKYGITGIGKAVFLAVSAFCNAGMDLFGGTSLEIYRDNTFINIVTMLLIILGGLGFPVWWDLQKVGKRIFIEKKSIRSSFSKFELHTKLVLLMNFILLFGGFLAIFIFEYNNINTLKDLSLKNKILASMFESVTLRTAGFFTIAQNNFSKESIIIMIILMFIGGSPSGTAGGVKTVTILVLILAVICIVKGKDNTEIFNRKINDSYVKKALAIVTIDFIVLIISIMLLAWIENFNLMDIVFELTSALATVGLSRGITTELSTLGKVVVIITMYIGRIGPIAMALFFNRNNYNKIMAELPEEKIIVG